MRQPWDPDVDIGPARVKTLLGRQFPELAPVSLEPFGEGWDNAAYLVNSRYIFRFPIREVAVPLIEIETRILPELAPNLALAIPIPIFIGTPEPIFPRPFSGYARLHGRSACAANLDTAQRTALARPLGHFLAALHGQARLGRARQAPFDLLQRSDPASIKTKILAHLDATPQKLPAARLAALERLLDTPLPYQARRDALVHGDLYVRHLLVDTHAQLTGIIDWGDCHLGDPATDLAIAWSFLPRDAHTAFREAYGPITEPTWAMARVRALFSGAALRRYGQSKKDRDLWRESETIFTNAL